MQKFTKIRKSKMLLLFSIYILGVFLSMIIWWFSPKLIQYAGLSTLTEYFVLFLMADSVWISILSLIWIVIFITSLIATFTIAWKKNKYAPFLRVIGGDILSTTGLIVYVILTAGYEYLITLGINFCVRLAVFTFLIKQLKKLEIHRIYNSYDLEQM